MTFTATTPLSDDNVPGREAFRAETPETRAHWAEQWPTDYGPLPLPDDRPPVLGPRSARFERSRAAFERLTG